MAFALVTEACGEVQLPSLTTHIMFEVNMGARRPDCVCLFTMPPASLSDADEARIAICLVLELKTCRFSTNMATESKKNQFRTGFSQLRDSTKLIAAQGPAGSETLRIVPLLIFVAQRGMRVLDKKKFRQRTVTMNVELLRLNLISVSAYTKRFNARGLSNNQTLAPSTGHVQPHHIGSQSSASVKSALNIVSSLRSEKN